MFRRPARVGGPPDADLEAHDVRADAVDDVLHALLPAGAAWVGQLIVDAVVEAIQSEGADQTAARNAVIRYVIWEAGLVVLLTGAQKVNTVCQTILRALLGNRINVMILEKALTLA